MPAFEAKTLDAGLAVIEALTYPIYKELTCKEISDALSMSQPKVLGLLEAARRRQWVEQTDDKRWRPAPKLTQLSLCCTRFLQEKSNELLRLQQDHLS